MFVLVFSVFAVCASAFKFERRRRGRGGGRRGSKEGTEGGSKSGWSGKRGKGGWEEPVAPDCFGATWRVDNGWAADVTVDSEYDLCGCDVSRSQMTLCGIVDDKQMECVYPMFEGEYITTSGSTLGRCVRPKPEDRSTATDEDHTAHKARHCLKSAKYAASATLETSPPGVTPVAVDAGACGCSADGLADHLICEGDNKCYNMTNGKKVQKHEMCEGTCECQTPDWDWTTAEPEEEDCEAGDEDACE